MKNGIFYILILLSIVACSTKKTIVVTEPEIRTVYVEKEVKNKVSDYDMMLLNMLRNGNRNFNTSHQYPENTWEGRLQARLLDAYPCSYRCHFINDVEKTYTTTEEGNYN
mgnify:CR=1 FL=1